MSHDLNLLDEKAWRDLVDRFGFRMWAVARACGLDATDATDAVQAAWLRLVEKLDTIRDPERIGAWLVTTTRNEARRIHRKQAGHHLGIPVPDIPAADGDPVALMLSEDDGRRLWAAIDALAEPCRTLLRLIVTVPEVTYAQLSRRMDMPIGSIGPTRLRCLRRVRSLMGEEDR